GGQDYYLGAVTDQHGRTLRAPLSFLDLDTTYRAEIYRDAKDAHWNNNPQAYEVTQQTVTANTVLELRLAPGGGQAIRFTPVD
ncbi:MAG: glycoside hydrolase family 97 C-terminal domain-containing protein, partial [Planctomycetales bacterium]|nr:glycoside hydrolase family 97 C-terminal domain-containing protein [Planctomycetales bacterium]